MGRKKILMLIFILALFLRTGGPMVREKIIFHRPFLAFKEDYNRRLISDSVWYDYAAKGLIRGMGLAVLDDWKNVRIKLLPDWLRLKKMEDYYYAHMAIPPLYPIFLATCYVLFGINTPAYFIPQVILGSLTCLLVYLLAKEIFNEKTAMLAGFAAALYPDLIFWTGLVRVETLFIFLIVLGFWLLVKSSLRSNIFLTCLSGVVFGLACLTRITFIPFIPFLFLWQVFLSKKDRRKKTNAAILLTLVVFLVLMPWCVRNYIVFRQFTPFTDEMSIPLAADGKMSAETESYFQKYDSAALRTAVYIKEHLFEYCTASLRRLATFWSPYTDHMRSWAKVYKTLTWIIVFPLAVLGMIYSSRDGRARLLIIFILYYSLLHAASFVDSGLVYRYPIQPFLCIFFAHGFWIIYGKIQKNTDTYIARPMF